MTDTVALHSPYSVSVTVAAILFAAWVATHVLHDRRLRKFGDPRLLGLGGMWPRRICSGILLAGAAGALLALVADTTARSMHPDKGASRLLILVDPPRQSPGASYAGPAWEGVSRDLLQVVEGLKPVQIAFYVTGSPPRMVVPSTKDVTAALLVLEAGRPGYETQGINALEASVEALRLLSTRIGTAEAAYAVVVASTKVEQEIDAVANLLPGGPPVIFVRPVPMRAKPVYRREGPNAQWVQLDGPESLRTAVMGHRRAPAEWQTLQILALTAFLLLYLEWAVWLSWPARRKIGPRAAPSRDFDGHPAVEGSNLRVFLCLLFAMFCVGAGHALASQSGHPSEASHLVSLEGIGPHAAVVTEISDAQPFVGQQFSVVYRLRCSIPPVAVDVDPQEFAGFWTVAVQTAAQARPDTVTLNGKAATDFLLRQVIAFPLRPGRQALPALRLKLKQDINSRDEWDLIRETSPVPINVKPVPAAGDAGDAFFMVGSLEASVSGADGDGSQAAVLEIEGTANLGLFSPELWFRDRGGRPLQARLKDAESLVQTRDYEGKRRLTLLQRQRWVVTGRSGGEITSLRLPVFDPDSSRWRSVEIRPFRAALGGPQAAGDPRASGGLRQQRGRRFVFLSPVTIAFAVSCLALLAVVIAGRVRRDE